MFPSSKRESDATLSAPLNVTIREIEVNSAVVTWEILEGDPVIGFAVTQQVPSCLSEANAYTWTKVKSDFWGIRIFFLFTRTFRIVVSTQSFIFKIKDGLIFTAPYQRSGAAW